MAPYICTRAVAAVWLRATLILAGTALSACTPPPDERPLRLIAHGAATEVAWPDLAGAGPPVKLRPAAIGDLPAPGAVVEVEMYRGPDNRDSRAALLAPTPSTYRFHVRLPRAPVLRLALGHLLVPEAAPRPVTFGVTVTPEPMNQEHPEAVSLLEERIETRPDGVWREREIDLARWAGDEVTLELAAKSDGAEPEWVAWGAPEIASHEAGQSGWDVILISLDTLRADHLSGYGYHRPTSPHLDNLAAGGVRFAAAVAQSPWTRPSHSSLFNGLYPASNGNLESPPLAEMLWRRGYRTGAITGGGQVDAQFGFQTGFESYRVHYWVREIDEAIAWLEAGRGRDDFLFLHTFEIHDPYTDDRFTEGLPSGRIEGSFSHQDWRRWNRKLSDEEKVYAEALYDGGIAFTDDALGALFAELEHRGLLERAIVVVTSDHGEQFWEHGSWRHGSTMYDHQLMVPLILHLPEELRAQLGIAPEPTTGQASGRVIERQVQLVDLYPTLLDLLGIERGHEVQGESLLPLLRGETLPRRRAFAENTSIKSYERKALRTEKFKLIYSFPKQSHRATGAEDYYELYDLTKDPGEQVNISDQFPDFVREQREQMRALREGASVGQLDEEVPDSLDPELRKKLEALGYLGE